MMLHIFRIKPVEPRRKAGTEQGVDGICKEQQDDEPRQPVIGIGDELGHERRGDDVHGVEVDLCREQNPFAFLEPSENRGGEHAETGGNVRDKGDDPDAGDGDAVHRQEAGVENPRNEYVVERGDHPAGEGDQTPLAFVGPRAVDVGERLPESAQIQ